MAKIFVNYRRDDDPAAAARVRDGLAQRFGKAALFMDVDNLLAGQKFDAELAKALAQCDVLVAVIGAKWSDLLSARIAAISADPDHRDYVREEIAGALKRDIVVIPVRVGRDGALPTLPRPSELPEDIRGLVAHQKHDVTHERFGRDVADLADAIVQVRRQRAGAGGATSRMPLLAGGAVAVAAAGYVAAGMLGLPVPGWPLTGSGPSGAPRQPPVATAEPPKPAVSNDAARIKADDEAFAVAERRGALDGYGAYLGQFPNGRHVTLANERIAYIKKLDTDFARLSASGTRAELEAFGETNKAFKPRIAEVLSARDAAAEQTRRKAEAEAEVKRKAEEEARRRADLERSVEETVQADPALEVEPGSGNTFRDCWTTHGQKTCGPEMVVVPAGAFKMGSDEGPKNERPMHTVRFSKIFAIGAYELTFGDWDKCAAAGACKSQPEPFGDNSPRESQPLVRVDPREIIEQYLPWLSKKTGYRYRLPSESEWEYAARAGTTTHFWFGNKRGLSDANINPTPCANTEPNRRVCSFDIVGGPGRILGMTTAVGSYKPNAFGLYDVHGNVAEYVADCYTSNYDAATRDGSSRGNFPNCDDGLLRRGGGWGDITPTARSAARTKTGSVGDVMSGFRLVRTISK